MCPSGSLPTGEGGGRGRVYFKMESFLIRAAQFILAITILVFLHEGGHFTFAKMFGTRVSRFYVFANWKFHLWSSYDNWWRRLRGKELVTERDDESVNFCQQIKNFYYSITGNKDKIVTKNVGNKKYNDKVGTEYGIGWLPLGGYCQIDGMIDETQTAEKLSAPAKPWEFRSKKAYQRLLIMAGGVMVNFFLALIIYSAVFYTWGDEYYAVKDMTMGMKFNDEAKALGFQDHDILLRSDLGEFKDFSGNLMRDISKAHEVIVLRNNREVLVPLNGDLNLLNMLKAEPMFCMPYIPALIDSVDVSSPAYKAGMHKGDTIVKLGSKKIDTWTTFNYEVSRMSDALTDAKTSRDSIATLTNNIVWKKTDGSMDTAQVVFNCVEDHLQIGVLRARLDNFYKPHHDDYDFMSSLKKGPSYGIDVLSGYVSDLKYVATKEGAKSLGGFGAMGSMFPDHWDWMIFWKMTAFLSIILAFMNIIPIPGLDGGHILFLLVEVITRKQPSLKFMQISQNIGMGFLLLLMIVANLNDILRWIGVM